MDALRFENLTGQLVGGKSPQMVETKFISPPYGAEMRTLTLLAQIYLPPTGADIPTTEMRRR